MKLTKQQKIFIVIGSALLLLLIGFKPTQEAIAVLDTTVYVKSNTGSPVVEARIDWYQHDLRGKTPSTPSFTVYTDSVGKVRRIIAQGIYTVKITATGFDILTMEDLDLRTTNEINPSRTYTFTLVEGTGGNPPPGSLKIRFYMVDPANRRVSGYITVFETYLTDAHGYAQIYLVAGTYTINFKGSYYQSQWNYVDFNFDKTITVSGDATYTVYVATASVLPGNPPKEVGGGYPPLIDVLAWLTWLTANWQIMVFGLVLLFILTRK